MRPPTVVLLLALVLVALAASAQAGIPPKISYQVMLTDASHEPLAAGDYSMAFRIYDDPEAGFLLWSEGQTVSVNDIGVASVMLGESSPINIDFDGPCYLEIQVGGETLEPRRELVSVPYAFRANHADTLAGVVDVRTVDSGPQITVTTEVAGAPAGLALIRPGSGLYDWRMRTNAGDLLFSSSDDDGLTWDPRVTFTRGWSTIGVGIGTTTPSAELDVAGTIETEDLRVKTGATPGYVLTSDPSGNATWQAVPTGGSDGDWTISGDDLYPAVSGNVGIGTTVPGAPLHVNGNNWDLDATEGDFKIGNSTYRLKMGVATLGGGAGTCGIRAMGGSERLIMGAGSAEVLELDSYGSVKIGSPDQDATIEFYRAGSATPIAEFFDYFGLGGGLTLSDESGNDFLREEPDFDGQGGWFEVLRNEAGNYAFRVDGNYAGLQSAYMSVSGTGSSASFNTYTTGDLSVMLPQSSISAYETQDEPGVSSSTYADYYNFPTSDLTVIRSSTITAPVGGYALVIGSSQAMVYHANGSNSSLDVGVSDVDTSLPPNQDVQVRLSSSLPTGTCSIPVTVHGLFEVTQGENTFYLLARQNEGNIDMYDLQLTVMYVPTAYGSVSPTLARGRNDGDEASVAAPLPTPADIAAEQAESRAANDARIEREIAEIRERLEAIESASGNND